MKYCRREDKLALTTSLIAFSCVLLGILFYIAFGHKIIESVYKGESLEVLNKILERHRVDRPYATLEHYFTLSRLLLTRLVMMCIAVQLLVVITIKYRYVLGIMQEFFTAMTHPINLAVFRVVLFYTIFHEVHVSYVMWFSQLPMELRFAPTGLGWLLAYLPINATYAQVASLLLLVFCVTGILGLFTRTSALLITVLSFYVLGIPNFYGKVGHGTHHLVWFAAVLAASRCGDVFSCDALIAAWRRADHGVTEPPGPSRIYALPLRFVWLLMGVLYFFPGFWKLWSIGVDWALSDNLKFIMYSKWLLGLNGWTPAVRIDQYPFLCQLGAVATVIFELSFIFLIFSKRLRFFAPLGGFMFHKLSDIFLDIYFQALLRCYVVFFDWHAIFHHVGRWMYKEDMYVLYDGSCKLCRRTMASLRVFDIFERVTYVNALDEQAIKDQRLRWIDSSTLLQDMHVVVGTKSWTGFSAYRILAMRIPILWPVVPFLYLWPLPMIACRVYRYVADSRWCNIPREPSLTAWRGEGRRAWGSYAVIITGSLFLLGNIIVGVGDVGFCWPLARYPSFAVFEGPETSAIEIAVLSSTGEVIPLNEQALGGTLAPEQYFGLLVHILSTNDEAQRRIQMQALWRVVAHHDVRLQQARAIRVYDVTLVTIPERRSENPIRRELRLELQL